MNVLSLITAFGKSLNYGKAIEDSSKDSGIFSSYIRNHLGPAFAALLGLMILAAGVKWLLDSAFSTTSSMKKDVKIGNGGRPQRQSSKNYSSFERGNRPKNKRA